MELGDDHFDGRPALGEDPSREAGCASCGWSGALGEVGTCPRCGAVVDPGMPSTDEVRAARQAPEG